MCLKHSTVKGNGKGGVIVVVSSASTRSSVDRAAVSGAACRGFESSRVHRCVRKWKLTLQLKYIGDFSCERIFEVRNGRTSDYVKKGYFGYGR